MKLKFNLDVKNFEYKQFFLKYGEWIGLGIALLITLPVLYSGIMKALTSGSSKTNAAALATLSDGVKQKISTTRPPPGTDDPPPAAELRVDITLVDAKKFGEENKYFVHSSLEETKRGEVTVLAPSDFHADIVKGGVLGNSFLREGKSIKVMVLKEAEANPRPKKKGRSQRFQQLEGMGSGFGAGQGRAMGGMGGMGGMGAPPGIQQGQQQQNKTTTRALYVDVGELEKRSDVRLAEVMYPVRMAVITAGFPYKEQMEAFRSALHMHSLNELVDSQDAPFQFKGATIMRRVYSPNGKLTSDWEDYTKTLVSAFSQLMASVPEVAPEDADLAKFEDMMIVSGLVMPRPPLARGEYPKIEIPSLQKTIKAISTADKDVVKPPRSFMQKKAEAKSIDPFDPKAAMTDEPEEKKPEPRPQPKPRETTSAAAEGPELLVPDYVLLRFVDVTVKPGFSYEYKIKVKMVNPNYLQNSKVVYAQLAKEETIEAPDFTPVPRVNIPYDISWYAMDEDGNHPDGTQAQIHHWLEEILTSPKGGVSLSVGDWSVLEKLALNRGEYIGQRKKVELPVWNPESDGYELARSTQDKLSPKKVEVDFTVRTLNAGDPALLVDYQGGRSRRIFDQSTVSDEEPVRFLVFSPDGKLLVRNSADDIGNEARKARAEEAKKFIADAKQPKSKQNGQFGGNQGPQGLFDRSKGGGGIGPSGAPQGGGNR